ncbi:ABC-2 type transport system ATP-binding protein [Pelagirhabdus alkalitolerans]|uniref:ABC-2 type transport system ATP-binding protein n=1 Tax=Pelagirhabdus alkalitolerans TaxID=1612202 RepID=A0A1G6JWU0_9BACI|nr:ABC transporter ATP-binding protein [Pelagirhabdus alkalitolerans]SDC23200.1 ABC-2 type transport system ATP-binding protein [Pelagirhabdus alkalitolerans]
MSEAVLDIQSLRKTVHKGKNIVEDVSFKMHKGEILGLLGPNGAGKTTTIRMIVGLIKRSSGSVSINGTDMDEDSQTCKRQIGAIVENPAFYDYMSGWKNLQQHARMAIDPVSDERMQDIIKLVQLEDAIHDKVKKYSLGMKQRLGVAQALLHQPSILILDEPTNGLDPKGIRELRDYLRELADQGISTLVSSHLLSEMQLMCDRVVIMEKGRLIDETVIGELDQSDEQKVCIVAFQCRVDQIQEAKALIEADSEIELLHIEKEQTLVLKLHEATIPDVNKKFVEAGIDIYAIERKKTTLEEKFLSLTNTRNMTDIKEVQS